MWRQRETSGIHLIEEKRIQEKRECYRGGRREGMFGEEMWENIIAEEDC